MAYIEQEEKKYVCVDDVIDRLYDNEFAMHCPLDEVSDVIYNTPTANVEEVKHGEWILRRQSNGVNVHQCSVCGRPIYTIDEDLKDYAPYCHCGAKMDGRSDT